jgi:hypothetical protein
VYTTFVTPLDKTEINRRKNASLVQSRVPLGLRLRLIREARRQRVSVSALIAATLAIAFPVAPSKIKG